MVTVSRILFASTAFFAALATMAEPIKPGLWKEFIYDTPDMTPIVYGGESRSENVYMKDYCVYLDIFYVDGSTTWGERAEFEQGTHGWQKVRGAMTPRKNVKRIEMYALCRNGKEGGRVEFRNLFLERREGRGDKLYETRRSNRPFANTDEIYYSDFTGRTKTRHHETVAPDKSVWTPSTIKKGAAIWTAGSLRRITPTDYPSASDLAAAPRIDIDLAKRGAASAQILITTADDVEWKNATLRLPILKDAKGRSIKGSIEWQRVGYIPRGMISIAHPLGQPSRSGWWADPLLPAAPFRVRKGATQGLWITAHADANAASGTYSGEIEVVEGGSTRARVPVSVRVRDFALPATFGLDTAWGLMDGFLREAYPNDWKRIRRQAQDIMLDYRQNPDDISRTELPEIDDLLHARERGMSGFTVLNLVPPPKNPNTKWVCYSSPDEVFSDSFYTSLKARLEPYMAKLRAHGLDKFARLYGFDERGSEYYPGLHKLCARLKADFPTLPVLTTALLYNDIDSRWSKFLAGNAKLDDLIVTDIYCPLTVRWRNEISDYLRSKGKIVYWYTAGSPTWPYANFAGYYHPLTEGRLVLGFQTHYFRADGYLFWHVNFWNGKENAPFDDADTFLPSWHYTNGDGILLYPGKDRVFPSIRLATVRDGVQDFEWLQLSQRKCGREKVDAVSRTIIRSLKDFERTPEAIEKARATIADMIESAD